jgi:putative transposase
VTRFRFVDDHTSEFPIERLSQLVGVPRSSFYAWKTRVPSKRELDDRDLMKIITDIYVRSRRTYGVPRVLGQLHLTGHRVAKSRVARLMKANKLVGATTIKKWRVIRADLAGIPDDLYKRDFTATAPNQRWVADMTEFPTGEGKLHLAGIRDLFHRGIVGWATGPGPNSNLAVEALTMAMSRTGYRDDVIHHSDKGSAYTSLHFACNTGNLNVRLSFGSTGDAYDNAAIETVWARLKVEIAWIRGNIYFDTRAEAHDYLFEFIEVFYNRQRHQTGLGHRTPTEYMQAWQQRQNP